MALTPFRWIGAAIAGCLIAAVVILRNDATHLRESGLDVELANRVDAHARHAAGVAGRLRLARLTDSIRVANPATASTPPIRVLRDAALPPASTTRLDSLAWRSVDAVRDSGRLGLDIAFVYDTVSSVRGASIHRYGTYVDYVLPRNADERCLIIANVGRVTTHNGEVVGGFLTGAAVPRLLGPCAYYRAFGRPGARVDAWLQQRGWTFAGDGSWTRKAPQVDLTADEFWQRQTPMESTFGIGTYLVFSNEMSVTSIQCALGNADACDQIALGRLPRTAPRFFNGNTIVESYPALSSGRNYFFYYRGFGRREPYLLADMVRTMGHERFARFWTSNEPVPVAFEKASGEPLSQWTRRWLFDQYGPVPPRGAGVTPWAGAMSAVLMALAIFLAVRINAHRQFA